MTDDPYHNHPAGPFSLAAARQAEANAEFRQSDALVRAAIERLQDEVRALRERAERQARQEAREREVAGRIREQALQAARVALGITSQPWCSPQDHEDLVLIVRALSIARAALPPEAAACAYAAKLLPVKSAGVQRLLAEVVRVLEASERPAVPDALPEGGL